MSIAVRADIPKGSLEVHTPGAATEVLSRTVVASATFKKSLFLVIPEVASIVLSV